MKRQIPSLILAALLGGCTVGPDFERPALSPAAGYAAPDTSAKGGPVLAEGKGPALRWWEAFGSPDLNALVDRALASKSQPGGQQRDAGAR